MKRIKEYCVLICAIVTMPVAFATVYTAESTWFSVQTAGLENPEIGVKVGTAGEWTSVPKAPRSAISRSGKIEVDADYAVPLCFSPIETAEPMTRIAVNVELTACEELQTISGQKTGLCVLSTDKGCWWQVWNGGEWIAGAEVSSSDLGETYEITIETMVTDHAVKYSARKLPQGETFDICDWITCEGLTEPITSIAFYGETTLGDFSGLGVRKVDLEPGVQPENIEVVVIQGRPGSAILVDKGSKWMTEHGTSVPPPEQGGMNAASANGLTYLQSYVLGLDPTSPVAKPLVTAQQNPDPNKVAFVLGGVSVNRSSGARISYRVKTFANPDGTGLEATSDPVSYERLTLLDVPPAAEPVKYYRMEISID